MSDSYLWWRQALSGAFGPIYENDPQSGYYRMRKGKGEPWVPVAIWVEDGASIASCLVSGQTCNPFNVWTWCCRYPVSYETYVAVAERGEVWPEQLPAELNDRLGEGRFASLGHNSSGISEAEAFLEEIELVMRSALGWLEDVSSISSQVDADKAANYAERFSNLETRAEEARTAEKRPVLDLGKKIDAKWKPVIAKASDGKVRMKKALEPYLIAERDRRISRSGKGNEIEPPRAGTSGRRIGLRSRQIVSVSDQEALIAHYRDDQRIWSDKAVKDLVLKITETDLMAGLSIPGASLIEELTAA